MTDALALAGAAVIFFALVAVAIALALRTTPGRPVRRRPHRDDFRKDQPAPRRRRVAVVINPTKFTEVEPVKARLRAVAAELDWAEPTFYETTAQDPGTGQARAALADGADVVASLGGDGTVRCVASALVGTDIPLGLLPAGTGNLLARNLGLATDDLEAAFRLGLTGRNRPVDVGWVELDPVATAADDSLSATATAQPERHAFLVMAGLGLDATIMAETSEDAKARIGWTAYAATGLRNFLGPRFRMTLAVDGGEPVKAHARTVLVGNCGRITGGIELMPDAVVDDGLLDCVVLSPKGLTGWVLVTARVLTRDRKQRHERLARHTGTRFDITTDQAEEVQVDGDVIGTARQVTATIAPRSLLVRVGATVADAATPRT